MPAPYRLVIADDSPTTLAVLTSAVAGVPELEMVGRAADGPEAVEVVRALRPDVALLDVLMPGMSGADVVTTLRPEGLPTSFVLMSTLSEPELALRSAMAGAASFVDKGRGCGLILEVALAMARRWDGLR